MEFAYVYRPSVYKDRVDRERSVAILIKVKQDLLQALESSEPKDEKVVKLIAETKEELVKARQRLPLGNLQFHIFFSALLLLFVFMQILIFPKFYEQAEPRLVDQYTQTFRSHSIPPAKLGYFLTKNWALAILITLAVIGLMVVLQAYVRMSRAIWISFGLALIYAAFWLYLDSCVMHLGYLPLVSCVCRESGRSAQIFFVGSTVGVGLGEILSERSPPMTRPFAFLAACAFLALAPALAGEPASPAPPSKPAPQGVLTPAETPGFGV